MSTMSMCPYLQTITPTGDMPMEYASACHLAAQLRLHRAGHEWRGDCPACGYGDAFVLTDGKHGAIGWCASCQDRDAIAAALGGSQRARTPAPQQRSAADVQARMERAERLWRGAEPVLGTAA